MRAHALAVLAVALALPAAAELYKWVDEKGVTHYSETPPPDANAKRIELPPAAPATKPESPERWKERELELRKRRLEKERAEEDEKAGSERSAERRREICLRARRALDVLEPGRPVYRVNERGERVYIDDAQRAAETDKWRKEADSNCDR